MDFDLAKKVLGEVLCEILSQKGWSPTQVAELLGKNRSHVCKAKNNTPDMGFDQLVMYYIVLDIDMNQLMQRVYARIDKAPRKLKKD